LGPELRPRLRRSPHRTERRLRDSPEKSYINTVAILIATFIIKFKLPTFVQAVVSLSILTTQVRCASLRAYTPSSLQLPKFAARTFGHKHTQLANTLLICFLNTCHSSVPMYPSVLRLIAVLFGLCAIINCFAISYARSVHSLLCKNSKLTACRGDLLTRDSKHLPGLSGGCHLRQLVLLRSQLSRLKVLVVRLKVPVVRLGSRRSQQRCHPLRPSQR
jgi:hypothetical protein